MKYTTLLFDADGTLFDFSRSENIAIRQSLAAFGLPDTDDVVKKYSEINDRCWKLLERGELDKKTLKTKRFEDLCECCGFENIDCSVLSEHYAEALSNQCYLLDGAEKLCASLYGKARMYIITNGIGYVQRKRFWQSPIGKYFDGLFISEEIGFEKPAREFFLEVEKSIPDFDHDRALVIGDSFTSDILGGINAELDTCWYDPKGKNCELADHRGITYIASTLEEVGEIILNSDR